MYEISPPMDRTGQNSSRFRGKIGTWDSSIQDFWDAPKISGKSL